MNKWGCFALAALGCLGLLLPAVLAAETRGTATAFSINDASIVEGGGSLQFTVTATPPPSTLSTVDFAASSGTLTFNVGVATRAVVVNLVPDNTVETDEGFNITLSNPSAGATLTDALGIGTIQNDDQTTVSLPDSEVDEGDSGTVPMNFAISLSNPVQGVVNIAFQSADGNAGNATLNATVADNDYAAASGSVSFANLAIGPQPIAIAVTGDTKVEPDQSLRLSVSIGSLPVGIDPADVMLPAIAAIGQIINDDGAVVGVGDIGVNEGNAGTVTLGFPVMLSNPSKTAITVDYAASAGSAGAADFTVVSGTLTIPAYSTSAMIQVPVSPESLVEPNETVLLTLSGVTGGFIGDDVGIGTIVNDDSALVSIANTSLAEGNAGTAPMTFTLSLSNPVQGTVDVAASSADGADTDPLRNATLGDNDYQAVVATVSFAAGAMTRTMTVAIVGDLDVEPDQFVRVVLSNLSVPAGLPVSLGASVANGTILNDDATSVSVGDTGVTEGTGATVNLVFPIALTAPSKVPVRVDYSTVAQTATAGSDFVAVSGTLTIPPNTTGASITVVVVGDNVVEASETLRLLLSNAQGASIGDGDALGTIIDNDDTRLRLADGTATEQQGGTLTLLATLSNRVQQAVTVQYVTIDGGALAGADYVAANGQIVFPPLSTSVPVNVQLINDAVSEQSESFRVTLSNPVPGAPQVILERATATATIFDDEPQHGIPTLSFPGTLLLMLSMGLLGAWMRPREA